MYQEFGNLFAYLYTYNGWWWCLKHWHMFWKFKSVAVLSNIFTVKCKLTIFKCGNLWLALQMRIEVCHEWSKVLNLCHELSVMYVHVQETLKEIDGKLNPQPGRPSSIASTVGVTLKITHTRENVLYNFSFTVLIYSFKYIRRIECM